MPELGDAHEAHERTPAQRLADAADHLAVIAAALDPYSTAGLGLGNSDARTASSPGPTRVPISAVGVLALLPPNRARRGLSIFHENPVASILYVCFGSNASAQNYTVAVLGGALYELQGPPFYIGEISAFCSTATGAAQVTELV